MRYTILVTATMFFILTAFAGSDAHKRSNDSTKVEHSSENLAEASPDAEVTIEETEEQDADLWQSTTLTGNWNGTRNLLSENGIGFSLGYKADNISSLSGGLAQRSSYLHNIDLVLTVDAERLLNWKGGSFLVHAMSNNGIGFSRFIGDAQTASNIDAPKATKLYQAWVQQILLGGKLSLLAGLYDANSEFYVVKTSLMFLNSSFGVGKELSQTGRNGPSIFPTPSAGLRIRIQPDEAIAFQFAAFDAVAGNRDDRILPSLFMSSEEGALVIGEVSYSWLGVAHENIGAGKFTLGGWFYTAQFDEVQANAATGNLNRSTGNNGYYLLAEQTIYAEDELQGFSIFTRLGVSNGDINQYDYNLSAGAVYVGLIPNRDADKLGFAFTHANNSSQYKRATLMSGSPVASGELAIEFTYRAQIAPWLAVQPDFQYIIHPGGNPSVQNASVFCTRFEVGF